MSQIEFYRPDQIHLSNGTCLTIKHIGHSTFSSPFQNKKLVLNQLLHVLAITKNLLNVSKFASDNYVSFEFDVDACFIKDQITKQILLTEKLRNGLYAFYQSQPFPQCINHLYLLHFLPNHALCFLQTLLHVLLFNILQILLCFNCDIVDWGTPMLKLYNLL